MVSLIKGNGTECAGHLAVGAAGRAAERDGGRASAGTPGRGGTALHPRGDRRTHPQGADLFGRAAGALAVWAAGLADIEGVLALLIIGVVFGVVYGAYAMFWMAETLPRYYDENRICNFAQGAFHIHIPGIYYNNRNWKHILRAFRVWSMASLVLVPPCTAGAVLLERATGWQVCGAVLVVYIASLFGAIVIPAKRFE